MYTGWLDGIIDCGAKLLPLLGSVDMIGMDFGVLWSGRLYISGVGCHCKGMAW